MQWLSLSLVCVNTFLNLFAVKKSCLLNDYLVPCYESCNWKITPNLENLQIIVFKLLIFNSIGESPMIPEEHAPAVIAHVCMVHTSVGDYSKLFLQKLRRCNFVTPKNYLDFINTYSSLLEENDQFILGERWIIR